ncbi:hypothetical protein EXIGLDRAFT_774651 [Exidia glandulosa HHB12029]|uniref:Aminoglycoside phosphotransferase domain-containing protein n=1 Tax=Exidia glandulosa HHB12029 TaxID=1314781 RepID=A0A165EA47_EXIGL|nr:hypothetical protein EXIGLDRAFT_774651 [Exidia glandulosa HHB12029]
MRPTTEIPCRLDSPRTYPTESEVFRQWKHWNDDYELDHAPAGGIDIGALVDLSKHVLAVDENPSVEYFTYGGHNSLYTVRFKHTALLARFPQPDARDADRIEPAVASMLYARHILALPAPEVLAWSNANDNSLRAPFILQRLFEPAHPAAHKYSMTLNADLARCHAALMRPLPSHLHGIGQLGLAPHAADPADAASYILRPLSLRGERIYELPYPVNTFHAPSLLLEDIWRARWQQEMARSLDDSPHGLDARHWGREAGNHFPGCSRDAFLAVAEDMRVVIERALETARAHPEHMTPCLVNLDFAFRNVLVRPDDPHQLGLWIDWDDVYVMPLSLGIVFPDAYVFNPGCQASYYTDVQEDGFAQFPLRFTHELLDINGITDRAQRIEALEANMRVESTKVLDTYCATLTQHDPRLADHTLWETRRVMMKVHDLLREGIVSWWLQRDWLKSEARRG